MATLMNVEMDYTHNIGGTMPVAGLRNYDVNQGRCGTPLE